MNRNRFGHDTTADEVLEGIDLHGKLVLITGASSGIGVETARAMAARGAKIVVTARDLPKAELAMAGILAAHPSADITIMPLELASLASIRAFAKEFLQRYPALDLLINNAGVMACPFSKTEDGFELQFGTNHLGHFLLTNLLVPALLKAAPARIVLLSSRAHKLSPVVFEDLHFQSRAYNAWASYGQSKTANILHAVELELRLGARGVHAYAVHPGVIPTDLARHMSEADRKRSTGMRRKTIPAGAATTVYAATAPELEGKGGYYLYDCQVSGIDLEGNAEDDVMPYAVDRQNAHRLWAISEQMVGEKLTLA